MIWYHLLVDLTTAFKWYYSTLLLRPQSYLLWSVCSITSSLLAPRRTWILAIRVPFDFRLFSPSRRSHYRSFVTTMALADFSRFVTTAALPSVRPHGISRQSFLIYLPNLHIRVMTNFWTSRLCARLSAVCASVLGFCSSGYDFAIPSSRPSLATWTLGVAMGFVVGYAPCGLSPQIDGMPAIHKK